MRTELLVNPTLFENMTPIFSVYSVSLMHVDNPKTNGSDYNTIRGPWWCSGNTRLLPLEISGSNPGPCVGKLVVAY